VAQAPRLLYGEIRDIIDHESVAMIEQWKRFERLTQKIQQQLAPNARVCRNETIIGKSGARNQIDVTLRSRIGQYEFFCIIECKDWKTKVDIDTIRAFQSKVEDVQAMQGVIVSTKGFTSEAQKFADSHNIRLYELVDAESENWREAALIPIILGQISLKEASLQVIDTRTCQSIWLKEESGKPPPEEKIYLFERRRNRYILIRDFLEDRWDEIFKSREPKSDEWFETEKDAFFLYIGDGKDVPVIIRYRLQSETIWYYGHLSLRRCLGLLDQKTGELLTSEYLSNPLIFKEIVKYWPSTKNKNEIPFVPEHQFFIGHFFSQRDQKPPDSIVIEKLPLISK
jgi:hypothetical protein